GLCESAPADAIGNPSRYTLFRQGDRLQVTKQTLGGNSGATCGAGRFGGAPGACDSNGTCAYNSAFAFSTLVRTRDNPQVRGHFVDRMKEKVLGVWTESVGSYVVEERPLDVDPRQLLPAYSREANSDFIPFALAAGDVDRLVDNTDSHYYHDEAVFASA